MATPINARQISPISIWSVNQISNVNYLVLDNFTQYDFKGNSGVVYYTLATKELLFDSDFNSIEILTPKASGEIQLTEQVVSNWGSDDQVIFTFVAQQLNLTLV